MKYFIGSDNGGTGTKAALFDLYGKEIACRSVPSEAVMDRPAFLPFLMASNVNPRAVEVMDGLWDRTRYRILCA